MMLRQDKLCLESFRSSNLIHYLPEWRKSCQTNTRFKWSKKNSLFSIKNYTNLANSKIRQLKNSTNSKIRPTQKFDQLKNLTNSKIRPTQKFDQLKNSANWKIRPTEKFDQHRPNRFPTRKNLFSVFNFLSFLCHSLRRGTQHLGPLL
jgi:hypothetical protein